MARQGLPVKRIYLSGPMTGLPGLNFEAFHAMNICMHAGQPLVRTDLNIFWKDKLSMPAVPGCKSRYRSK
jgi:hypothetical protein